MPKRVNNPYIITDAAVELVFSMLLPFLMTESMWVVACLTRTLRDRVRAYWDSRVSQCLGKLHMDYPDISTRHSVEVCQAIGNVMAFTQVSSFPRCVPHCFNHYRLGIPGQHERCFMFGVAMVGQERRIFPLLTSPEHATGHVPLYVVYKGLLTRYHINVSDLLTRPLIRFGFEMTLDEFFVDEELDPGYESILFPAFLHDYFWSNPEKELLVTVNDAVRMISELERSFWHKTPRSDWLREVEVEIMAGCRVTSGTALAFQYRVNEKHGLHARRMDVRTFPTHSMSFFDFIENNYTALHSAGDVCTPLDFGVFMLGLLFRDSEAVSRALMRHRYPGCRRGVLFGEPAHGEMLEGLLKGYHGRGRYIPVALDEGDQPLRVTPPP